MDQGEYLGIVQLESALHSSFLSTNDSAVPTDADALPTYRVYGASIMSGGSGSLALKDPSSTGGVITAATNATPIVITSASHALTTGTKITIAGVLGNTAANGTFKITKVDNNTFSLDSSVGNGAWTSGGLFHVTGLYDITFTPQGANGFVAGQNYCILVTYLISTVIKGKLLAFTVV